MPRSLRKFRLYRFFLMNPRSAHLFMICSNIKLTGPAESIEIDALAIHEWNQRDSTMDVQRKLEILADANLARGIPQKALPFIVLSDRRPRHFDRHCERSEAIHHAAKKVWIASSASLPCANASRLSQAMTGRNKHAPHHPRQRSRFRRLAQSVLGKITPINKNRGRARSISTTAPGRW